MKRGLFCDFDGTLADTIKVAEAVFLEFLGTRGVHPSQVEFEEFNGPPLPVILETVARRFGWGENLDAALVDYDRLLSARYAGCLPNAGAPELLGAARRAGAAVGIVTSGSRPMVERWLHSHGFEVDVVVGREDVHSGKPAPDPYHLALELTGCAAETSIAVEDSLSGACSAIAAGLSVFLLARTMPGAQTIQSLHEVVRAFD